jgi:transposase
MWAARPRTIACLLKRCYIATGQVSPWRDLPERFGDFRVIHTRHTRWSKSGVWQRIFEALAADADNEYAMIDSTIVRAH